MHQAPQIKLYYCDDIYVNNYAHARVGVCVCVSVYM